MKHITVSAVLTAVLLAVALMTAAAVPVFADDYDKPIELPLILADEETKAPATQKPTAAPPTTAAPTAAPTTVTQTTAPTPSVLCGDINGDKIVNVKDATLVQRYLADLMEFDDRQQKAASVIGDKVTVDTVTEIQKFSVDLSTNPRIGTYI